MVLGGNCFVFLINITCSLLFIFFLVFNCRGHILFVNVIPSSMQALHLGHVWNVVIVNCFVKANLRKGIVFRRWLSIIEEVLVLLRLPNVENYEEKSDKNCIDCRDKSLLFLGVIVADHHWAKNYGSRWNYYAYSCNYVPAEKLVDSWYFSLEKIESKILAKKGFA